MPWRHTHTHRDAHRTRLCVDMHAAFNRALLLPGHLWAVCLKWQCLSMILRQIGREHRSIKGSHGATEGWNNGCWEWQKTQHCSLLNGLCRGGDFAPVACYIQSTRRCSIEWRLIKQICLCLHRAHSKRGLPKNRECQSNLQVWLTCFFNGFVVVWSLFPFCGICCKFFNSNEWTRASLLDF